MKKKMRKVKILHVVSTSKMNGAEKLALSIMDYLSDEFDFAIICNSDEQAKQYIKVCSNVYVCRKNNFLGRLSDMNRKMKEFMPDIIHAHDNRASLLSYIITKVSGQKSETISHIHNTYRFIKDGGLYKLIDRLFRYRYQTNIFCGKKVMDYYKSNVSYFSKLKRVIVLPNFTDVRANREKAGIFIKKEDKIGIAFVGRLEPQKGLVEFFSALAGNSSLIKHNIILHIIGDGELRGKLEKKALYKEMGLEVKFSGYIDNPQELVARSDLLVLPSRFEGLPLTLLEAMSIGIPVLAMDVGSISEVIDDNINGWLINEGDYTGFVDKMLSLCESRQTLRDIGDVAAETVLDGFDIEGYMEKLITIYYNLRESGGYDE